MPAVWTFASPAHFPTPRRRIQALPWWILSSRAAKQRYRPRLLAQESAVAALVTRKILPREAHKAVRSLRRRAARGHDGPDIDRREFTQLCRAENDRRR